MSKILFLNRTKVMMDDSFVLQKGGCYNIIYPDWHTRSMNYPTYYLDECLQQFSFEESRFSCRVCNSKALYYRFDMGFESFGKVYVPNRVDISYETLRKKGAPCFILVHILCLPFSQGCRASWSLSGTQTMIDIISSELDDEWIRGMDKWD